MENERVSKGSKILIYIGAIMGTINFIYYYVNLEALPRLNEGLSAWLHVTPALIALLLLGAGVFLEEQKTSENWQSALVGTLVSFSLVGFIILFGLLFHSN